jgi:FKBP-type peptidyl-prolyl cis-trans isomerase 2
MMVCEVKGDEVVLDGNHPLAGCNLTFALKLVAIERN